MIQFEAVQTFVSHEVLDGQDALRVVKDPNVLPVDEPTYARLTGAEFHNGVIEVQVLSRLLPDAPDYARGFIGVAFRISGANDRFEGLYLRPTNGRTDDPVRCRRAVQYFSYPQYKFDRLRQEFPGRFETGADIGLDEWISLRIEVRQATARLFLGGQTQPTLVVLELFGGAGEPGGVGLWVDVGTEGFFRGLSVRPE